MEIVFSGLSYEVSLLYLDGISVFGKTFEEPLLRLEQVFARLEKSSLNIKGSPCNFFQKRYPSLGLVVSEKGVEVHQKKWKQ